MNKKIITFGLLIIIMICCINVNAETLVDSNKVQYSGSRTDKKNVKDALDELMDKVDSIEANGTTAESSDLVLGKTAYSNGKLITGTKVDKPIYWDVAYDKNVYINNVPITVNVDVIGGVDTINLVYGDNIVLKVKSLSATQKVTHAELLQISPNVIAVYYGYEGVKTAEATSDNGTTYKYSVENNVYEILHTYVMKGGVLTNVSGDITISANGWNNFISEYRNDVYTYSTNVLTSRERKVYHTFRESKYPNYANNLVWFEILSNYVDSNYASNSPANCWSRVGYFYRQIGVNIYTGAITWGAQQSTSDGTDYNSPQFYYRKDPISYSNSSEYGFISDGLYRTLYTDITHSKFSRYDFYDVMTTVGTTGTTGNAANKQSTGLDNALPVRLLKEYYEGVGQYRTQAKFRFTGKKVTSTMLSSLLGTNEYGNPLVMINPELNSQITEVDLTDMIPSSVTVDKLPFSTIYDFESKKYFVTFKCSNGGKVYLQYAVDESPRFRNQGLKLILMDACYKEKNDGKELGATRLSVEPYKGNRLLKFYR